jgi:hypothetical protein
MKKRGRIYLAGLAILVFSFILFGGVNLAQAHDGTFGSSSSPEDINQVFTHDDAAPYKGFFMLWTQNSTSTAWTGFNLSIDSATSDAVFIDTATWDAANPSNPCSSWAYDSDCDPTSSFGISDSSQWSITNGGLNMSVTLDSTWGAGQVGWLKVYTDNSSSENATFNITVNPILVPEPVSSTLFLVGAATLGFRRFRKKSIAA